MPGGPSRRSGRLEPALVAAFALLFAAPLLMLPYVPGLDVPWHAAVIEILHRGDPDRFLGQYELEPQLSSYLTLYYAADALAHLVGGVPAALRWLTALYVVAFVWSARRLVRSFGGDGIAAVLAGPAAWCVTLEYGFLAYALAYPLTFWLWALAREMLGGAPGWRLIAVAGLSALIALTHPFAAALALVGLVVLVGTAPGVGWRRPALLAAVAFLAAAPAVVATAALARDAGGAGTPALVRDAGLWTRLTTHQYTPLLEAMSAAPARLFGYLDVGFRFALATGALCAAVFARHQAGAPAGSPRSRAWLVVVLATGYLITPFTFEWPRALQAAQPRLLPLLWVAALALLAWRPPPTGPGVRARAAPIAVAAVAVVLTWQALAPLAREGRDLRAVLAAAAPRARTLGLIEQRFAPEREPASPWRHASAYVLLERGGFVANLPFTSADVGPGILVVRRPVPPAPPIGMPWLFDAEVHGVHYDQLLIRDLEQGPAVDYPGELVARRGRWRLYRLRD